MSAIRASGTRIDASLLDAVPRWVLVALALMLGAYALLIAGLLIAGRRADARAMAGFIPDCLVLFRRLLADPEIPRRRKAALAILIAYLVSPVDLVPDFVPVLGLLDDAIVVVIVLRYVLRGADRDELERLWPGPDASLRAMLTAAYGRSDERR